MARARSMVRWYTSAVTSRFLILLTAVSLALNAQTTTPPPDANNRASLTIAVESLGDNDEGVVSRVTFRFSLPSDVPPGVPLLVQGSIMRGGQVVKNFRLQVPPEERAAV